MTIIAEKSVPTAPLPAIEEGIVPGQTEGTPGACLSRWPLRRL